MWRTQQSQSFVMKATEVEVTLSVREMGIGHFQACLPVQVRMLIVLCTNALLTLQQYERTQHAKPYYNYKC